MNTRSASLAPPVLPRPVVEAQAELIDEAIAATGDDLVDAVDVFVRADAAADADADADADSAPEPMGPVAPLPVLVPRPSAAAAAEVAAVEADDVVDVDGDVDAARRGGRSERRRR